MDDAKQQLIEKLTGSNNILVTVSRNPSVDQLASCIGLTLLLNKQGKHAAAVFSGKVPSTLEFLQPEDTLEKNTDSLRDFIISLDKAKADKLRYKVEEDVVRIFITPYKTSLSEADLDFSEGDFNVDVVVALGVQKQEDLDQAITAHGRILHDATVTTINTSQDGGLGTINWYDPQASSLSELVTDLTQALDANLLDAQIATALLTGIVSETGRFSNDRTSSQTMSASAALMAAGANQQLVSAKLEEKGGVPVAQDLSGDVGQNAGDGFDDGVLNIDHADTAEADSEVSQPGFDDTQAAAAAPNPAATDFPAPEPLTPPMPPEPEQPEKPASTMSSGSKLVTEPPTLGGTLTANSQSEQLDPVTDPFSLPSSEAPQLLDRKDSKSKPPKFDSLPSTDTPQLSPPPPPEPLPKAGPAKAAGASAEPPADVPTADAPTVDAPPAPGMTPAPETWMPPSTKPPTPKPPVSDAAGKKTDGVTLSDIEKSVGSPHADPASLDTVRNEVNEALSGTDSTAPITALNAQPLGDDLHPGQPSLPTPAATSDSDDDSKTDDPDAPPPVPPPIPFQFGNSPPPQ